MSGYQVSVLTALRAPYLLYRANYGYRLTHAETRLILAKLFWHFDLEILDEYKGWQDTQKGTVAWHRTPLECRLTSAR